MKIGTISDLHCGHLVGLTPPGWQLNNKPKDSQIPRTKRDKFALLQRVYWDFYESNIKKHGPFDVLFVNGDCLDGVGRRSGGTEQITTDREEQAEMAAYTIKKACSKHTKIVMTFGTAYHTGDCEDWESLVASDVGAEKIGSHEWVNVNGIIFDLKHHCGSSGIPHGRHTAVAKDHLWNQLWAERNLQPKSDVIIRSHVHYHSFCGGPEWLAMTTPALQGMGTKYGSRRCSGIVDFGFVIFETSKKGTYSWQSLILDTPKVAPKIVEL